jgi:prepilin-type N-terminal cleavage/methylation domain-containing protein
MRNSLSKNGFTLVELLVALIVTSIILTAVSTLAFALSSANKATGQMSRSQAQVRLTTLRIQEIIRNCNLVCYAGNNDIAIWLSDNNNDGKINIGELEFIECGSDRDHLQLCTFPSENNSEIALSSIRPVSTNWWSIYSSDIAYVHLLQECSKVCFSFDAPSPYSKLVNISFEMTENGVVKQYQINAALRSRKGNLLDGSGSIVSDDD